MFKHTAGSKKYDSGTRKFPPVSRDLAFVVADTTKHDTFCQAIKSFKKRNLSEWSLFDVYSGENLPQGKKSMAYTFSFSSAKKTLTDKEVEKEVSLLINHLQSDLGAELR